MKFGVNIDHVATLRNQRDTTYPSIVEVAQIAIEEGADFITAHLREDRRHVREQDLIDLKAKIKAPINLEMAATEEMIKIAKSLLPESVCIVPEKREEKTTEAGLDVVKMHRFLETVTTDLQQRGIKVTLFVDPDINQIDYAKRLGVDKVELHVGEYCLHGSERELQIIDQAAHHCTQLGMECHAGHGLNYESASILSKIPHIKALNIGHFLICDALIHGIAHSVRKMRLTINNCQ